MSKIDKVKEKIGLAKFWLGVVVASLLAVVGWGITNYAKAELWLLILSLFCVASLGLLGYLLSKYINKKINELEDL